MSIAIDALTEFITATKVTLPPPWRYMQSSLDFQVERRRTSKCRGMEDVETQQTA